MDQTHLWIRLPIELIESGKYTLPHLGETHDFVITAEPLVHAGLSNALTVLSKSNEEVRFGLPGRRSVAAKVRLSEMDPVSTGSTWNVQLIACADPRGPQTSFIKGRVEEIMLLTQAYSGDSTLDNAPNTQTRMHLRKPQLALEPTHCIRDFDQSRRRGDTIVTDYVLWLKVWKERKEG